MIRALFLAIIIATSLLGGLRAQDPTYQSPLGLPTTITDLYIPGEKIAPIPRTDHQASLVIRILETKPASDGFRYDLEVYGLDPGTHPLANFLHYPGTQSPVTKLDASIEITVRQDLATLPEPTDPAHLSPKKLGGYRLLIKCLGILWLLIFLLILFYKKKKTSTAPPPPPLPTLHEKLHALVNSAAQGDLSDQDRAKLERLVHGHWKKKLPTISTHSPSQALSELRTHPQASPLILKLEEWLHSPKPSTKQADLLPLLEPYLSKPENQNPETRNLPSTKP